MLISEIAERWWLFILFSFSYMPLSVWDHEMNRYLGFLRTRTISFMIAMMPIGVLFAWQRGETWAEILLTVAIGCLLMFVVPRVYAEVLHKRHFGVWLSGSGDGGGSRDSATGRPE